MTNYLKLSKVMMLVGALMFASFYSITPANADGRTDEENQAIEDAYNNKSKRSSNADQRVNDAEQGKKDAKDQALADRKKAAEEAEAASKAVSDYEGSAEYKKAMQDKANADAAREKRVKEAEQAHKDYIESEKNKHNATISSANKKLDDAKSAYSACVSRGGQCGAEYGAMAAAQGEYDRAVEKQEEAVKKAEKDKKHLDAIKNAGKKTDAEKQAEKAYKSAQDKLDDLKKKEKKAQNNVTRTNEQTVKDVNKALNESAKATEKQKKAAARDLQDAKDDYKSAQEAIEKHCTKDANSKKCKQAQQDMSDASARITAAEKRVAELNPQATSSSGAEDEDDFDFDDIEIEDDFKPLSNSSSNNAMNEAAFKNYNGAIETYKKQVEKYTQAQVACSRDPSSEECGKLKELKEAVDKAKANADEAYKIKNNALSNMTDLEKASLEAEVACEKDQESKACKNAQSAFNNLKKDLASSDVAYANRELQEKEAALKDVEKQLAEAQAACDYSKNLKSSGGQKDAAKYCAEAERLQEEYYALEADIEDAKARLDEAMDVQQKLLDKLNDGSGHKGQVYMPFETEPLADAAFANDPNDIFKTMTRRAMRFLLGIKPLVYMFAGFGLIGFAWAAVFNKISWKWFSNIAMGLFLVANLGRFIEYFVYPEEMQGQQSKTLEYGDHLVALSSGYADAEYVWIDEITPYSPPKIVGEDELPDTNVAATEESEEEEKKKRGFCESEGGGLFASFTSCIGDIVTTVQKAADTVETVQGSINNVKGAIQQAQISAENIRDAASQIGKGSLSDTLSAFAAIGDNLNVMVGTAGNTFNVLAENAGDVSNNLQDMGKSTDQVADYEQRRNSGEATTQYNANRQGQYLDENGEVERLWDGSIASNETGLNKALNKSDDIVGKADSTNASIQNGLRAGKDAAKGLGSLLGWGRGRK